MKKETLAEKALMPWFGAKLSLEIPMVIVFMV
jgi:hypothetical protein